MAQRSVMPIGDPERELPAGSEPVARNPEWNETAEHIGSAIGRAVNKLREVPEQAANIQDDMRRRLSVIRGGGGQSAVSRLRDKAQMTADELMSRAQENIYLLRSRAERIVRERPVDVIIGAFTAAFVLGVALRIWRSNRD